MLRRDFWVMWGIGAMIRSELLQVLAKDNPELRAEEVERAVDTFFDEIAQRLADGGRVELRGFGAFSTRHRDGRKGRNPRTGEAIAIEARRVVTFHASHKLKDQIQAELPKS